ncbi:MAG: hypothetical protein RO257_04435 [Candidatus Kapabacteria bacterium]|nr:hypothetical protein [Candidatus Kapabacteria bacterium]
MKAKIYIFIFFLAVMSGCECVPDIVTPKIISPDNYTNALILNCIADRDILLIESNDIPLLKKAEYTQPSNIYQKINSGSSYLRLIDEQSNLSLVNMPVQLDKLGWYTIIFYGYRFSAKSLILKDTTSNSSSGTDAYFRFVHTSFDSGEFIFKLSGQSNFEDLIGFKSFTDLKKINSGIYKLELINPANGNEILEKNGINIESNKIYNILLKGTSVTLQNKPLILDIISSQKN